MTLDEYLQLPFKTDGEGNDILIKDIFVSISRRIRRKIQRELKKGKIPDITYFL